MGRRMSGSPSWALNEPSANSTSECTTLWGWITASILEYGSRYSHLASMTSNALLTSVAESIVIFGPIRQVGCANASDGVTLASSSAGPSPKGSAARREDQTFHLVDAFPHQALPDRGMLAVNRPQAVQGIAAAAVEGATDEVAAGDQRLLVRQRYAPAAVERS